MKMVWRKGTGSKGQVIICGDSGYGEEGTTRQLILICILECMKRQLSAQEKGHKPISFLKAWERNSVWILIRYKWR